MIQRAACPSLYIFLPSSQGQCPQSLIIKLNDADGSRQVPLEYRLDLDMLVQNQVVMLHAAIRRTLVANTRASRADYLRKSRSLSNLKLTDRHVRTISGQPDAKRTKTASAVLMDVIAVHENKWSIREQRPTVLNWSRSMTIYQMYN